MSHVGKKPQEATIFDFTSVVQIAKWLLHDFRLEAVLDKPCQKTPNLQRESGV
jgi:hypothetical protein